MDDSKIQERLNKLREQLQSSSFIQPQQYIKEETTVRPQTQDHTGKKFKQDAQQTKKQKGQNLAKRNLEQTKQKNLTKGQTRPSTAQIQLSQQGRSNANKNKVAPTYTWCNGKYAQYFFKFGLGFFTAVAAGYGTRNIYNNYWQQPGALDQVNGTGLQMNQEGQYYKLEHEMLEELFQNAEFLNPEEAELSQVPVPPRDKNGLIKNDYIQAQANELNAMLKNNESYKLLLLRFKNTVDQLNPIDERYIVELVMYLPSLLKKYSTEVYEIIEESDIRYKNTRKNGRQVETNEGIDFMLQEWDGMFKKRNLRSTTPQVRNEIDVVISGKIRNRILEGQNKKKNKNQHQRNYVNTKSPGQQKQQGM